MTQRMQRRRWLVVSLGIAAMGLAVASLSVPAAGQSQAPPGAGSTSGWTLAKHRDLVRKLRTDIGVPASWKTPRTSWGDPDLQGQWTSDSVHGVPRERSEQFAGRAFLTDAEYAERVKREAQTRSSAENASSPNTNGRDRAWRGNVTFRMTSMIMDPPDGRIPPLMPEAQSRPIVRGTWGTGPHNGPEDFTLYDRCITRGIIGSVLPVCTATATPSYRRRTRW